METVSNFPRSLTFDPNDVNDLGIASQTIFVRSLVQLEHLQNIFFLERLLLRGGHPDEGNLLVTSFEMVSLTLMFWKHKDRFAAMRSCFEWLVS